MNLLLEIDGDNINLLSGEDLTVVWTTPNTHGAYDRACLFLYGPGCLFHCLGIRRISAAGVTDSIAQSGNGIFFPSWDEASAYNSANNRGYAGCVLSLGEHNYHDDSDFYAIVWDEVAGCARKISDGTTRFAAPAVCRVDATPEVRAKATAWNFEASKPGHRRVLEARAREVRIGREVRVVKGRKVAKGTIAWVVRIAENRFGKSALLAKPGTAGRVAGVPVELESGADWQWTSIENLEVVNPKPVTDEEVAASVTAIKKVY